MGTIKWAVYRPEDINWEARSRVDAWSRHDGDLLIDNHSVKHIGAGSGLFFTLAMLVLAAATYMLL